jgi:hypothetical protein
VHHEVPIHEVNDWLTKMFWAEDMLVTGRWLLMRARFLV